MRCFLLRPLLETSPPCRYGDKLDAVALVQEWVRDIGSQAGLSPAAVRINSGSVGVPESRLEVSSSAAALFEGGPGWKWGPGLAPAVPP